MAAKKPTKKSKASLDTTRLDGRIDKLDAKIDRIDTKLTRFEESEIDKRLQLEVWPRRRAQRQQPRY